jgi:alkaline phosphatase
MRKIIFIYVSFVFLVAAGCSQGQAQVKTPGAAKVKNVVMIIGDGMGPQQVGLLLAYAKQAPNSVIKNRTTAFEKLVDGGGRIGISMTYAADVLVTDSAASATQLASGSVAGSEMVGSDNNGDPTATILEKAQALGKSTGLVSDTLLTHATPAGFAAHQPHRSFENEIAVDLLNTGPDVMLSGGLGHWIPKEANARGSVVRKELEQMTAGSIKIKSKRADSRNLLKEAQQKGYVLAFNKSQLERAHGKVLGLFANSAMTNAIRENRTKHDPERTQPTLKEMSIKAIEVLSKNGNGFFLMIEAGQIDWAAHAHDTGALLHELLRLNETLNYVLDWAEDRNDTLIIVTADHETGGFGFSYSANDLPRPKALPGKVFKNRTFKPTFNFGNPAILDKLYYQKLSYWNIFSGKFDGLPKNQQTPEKLAELVNTYTEFKIICWQEKWQPLNRWSGQPEGTQPPRSSYSLKGLPGQWAPLPR